MVVHSGTTVTQEAQDYLKQFKGARPPGRSKHAAPDETFEAMLDTWTREKFQLKNGKKAASSRSNHSRQHHDNQSWEGMPAMLEHMSPSPGDSLPGNDVGVEGELFAEAELDQEQETYMNEEALLEQLLQQEPPKKHKRSSGSKSKISRNKNHLKEYGPTLKEYGPSHSTPRDSHNRHRRELLGSEYQLENVSKRRSKRGNPPPPPPRQQHNGDSEVNDMLPPCHNCGFTYTIAENEVLDLPELLDILTPKSVRKQQAGSVSPERYLPNAELAPPLPSKPRPPPPAFSHNRGAGHVANYPHLGETHVSHESQHIDIPQDIPQYPISELPLPPFPHTSEQSQRHSHTHSQHLSSGYGNELTVEDAFGFVQETAYAPHVQSGAHLDNLETIPHSPRADMHTDNLSHSRTESHTHSPRYSKPHSPRAATANPNHSPRSKSHTVSLHLSTRGTQTDPNLLPQDLSPMAVLEKDKSSDTDNGKPHRDRLKTRAKPPSGRQTNQRNEWEEHGMREVEPILEAAKQGNLERMIQMIHADPEQLKLRDIQGNNLMHICCERGHVICVKHLYQHFSYQCEEENKSKFTPAVLTIKGGQPEVLEWLLEHTAAKDEILPLPYKKSLLHHAAKFGQDNCLRIVLEKLSGMGQLTACSDGNGNSPAHVAAKHGHLSCLQTLVEYGMDVTKANKYGHSPCYYADFSNHRQCAGYLMVVETCLNLAKKLIRLEKSMEQLSTSLAKYSDTGDFNQGEINFTYDYGLDKSSATSSVEDDGTRDDAWQLLCRKFEEASKRLVVFRTQNRAIRPLRPTKLAMLALAQTKEETQAAFNVLTHNTKLDASKSLDNSLDGTNVEHILAENRSRSFPDLLNVQCDDGSQDSPLPVEEMRPEVVHRSRFGDAHAYLGAIPKHHQSQPDLTTSDEGSYPVPSSSVHKLHNSLPTSMSHSLPHKFASIPHGITFTDTHFGRNETGSIHRASNNRGGVFSMSNQLFLQQDTRQGGSSTAGSSNTDKYDNDLEYHLQTRVLSSSKTSSFRPEKYLIHNRAVHASNLRPHISNLHPHVSNLHPHDSNLFPHMSMSHNLPMDQFPLQYNEIPPPPLDNETSDFFEDSNGRHDSDTSELDAETLKKIFDMQEEIMRCHPKGGAELGRTRIQTPVKLKLSAQDFKESYERPPEGDTENTEDMAITGLAETEEEGPPILRRFRGFIRMRAPPPDPPPLQHRDCSNEAMDVMNKSGNNSHPDGMDNLADEGALGEVSGMSHGARRDLLDTVLSQQQMGVDVLRPWYEITDDEETKQDTEQQDEYFTLL